MVAALVKYNQENGKASLSEAEMILKELRARKLIRVSKGKEKEIVELLNKRLSEATSRGVVTGCRGILYGAEILFRKLLG